MFEDMQFTHTPSETKVAVLAGGNSNERDISLRSAEGASGALKEAGYQIEQLDPANPEDLKKLVDGGFDVAFLCLHGKGGEDGAIQGFCETIGLPYTCSGIWGSAVSMDKTKTKLFYEAYGVPTATSTMIEKADFLAAQAESGLTETEFAQSLAAEIIMNMGKKVVVKAATEGSSIGVYIVEGQGEIAQALLDGFEVDKLLLIEEYIAGTELTCVVIGSGETAQALPIIEIVPKNESYDFESKYAPGGCEHICPARISDEATKLVQEFAVLAQNALGCSGAARTDFLLDAEGNPWALETNTVPGMTATSLLPDAAAVAGISFPELCKIMIQLAFDR